jgi:hypothetical protein
VTGRRHIEQSDYCANPHLAAGWVEGVDHFESGGGCDSIDVVAQHRITSQRQDAFSRGHAPTLLAGYDAAPSGRHRLGMNPKLGHRKGIRSSENHVPQLPPPR